MSKNECGRTGGTQGSNDHRPTIDELVEEFAAVDAAERSQLTEFASVFRRTRSQPSDFPIEEIWRKVLTRLERQAGKGSGSDPQDGNRSPKGGSR